MIPTAPVVMISSTFFDLKQIRSDLTNFLTTEMGYQALLSELDSFPIDPDVSTVENCRRRVELDANILVLVIGGRFGSMDKGTGTSVTNLEYLAARAKGIPIYAYVEKRVLAMLPLWRRNPDMDFGTEIDDARLLKFVEQVRTIDGVWMQEFETAQHIVTSLRSQFAHLARQGVSWFMMTSSQKMAGIARNLSGEALRLCLQKPTAWEYLLLGQVIEDGIDEVRDLRMEYQLGLAIGIAEYVPEFDMQSWSRPRMAELNRIIAALHIMFGNELREATGPPGAPGDAARIVFLAKGIVACYVEALSWSQRIRRAAPHEAFAPAVKEMARFADDLIEKVGGYGRLLIDRTNEAVPRMLEGEHVTIEANLQVDFGGNVEAFKVALKAGAAKLGIPWEGDASE